MGRTYRRYQQKKSHHTADGEFTQLTIVQYYRVKSKLRSYSCFTEIDKCAVNHIHSIVRSSVRYCNLKSFWIFGSVFFIIHDRQSLTPPGDNWKMNSVSRGHGTCRVRNIVRKKYAIWIPNNSLQCKMESKRERYCPRHLHFAFARLFEYRMSKEGGKYRFRKGVPLVIKLVFPTTVTMFWKRHMSIYD